MEIRRHYANHFAADTFKFDGATNNSRVAPEALFPKGVAQNDIVVLSSPVFTGIERSPQLGTYSQDREQLR